MSTTPTAPAPSDPIQQSPPGSYAPAETGTPAGKSAGNLEAQPGQYGPNNEELPEVMQTALSRLIRDYKMENQVSRRNEIRRIRQAKEFWKGLQYIYWHEGDQLWHLPFEQRTGSDAAVDAPRYTYVTNYFQAYGLSIIAVLSQDIPKTRFWPANAEEEDDTGTAKAATTAAQLIERNNRMGTLMQEEAFELWTGGKVGAYVRYVVDGQRFGFHPEDDLGETAVKLGDDAYVCAACGADAPADQFWGVCPECGTDMDEQNLQPAPTVRLPVVKQTVQTPNGEEVISLHGGLELTTPIWANKQYQMPYLIWDVEAHVAELKTAFPKKADKIGETTAGDGQTDIYERLARIQLQTGGQVTEAGDINKNLITFRRAWLRPWAWSQIKEPEVRAAFMKVFPNGAYVGLAGDVYCESRNESMDDHWRVMHAMPGDGQDRNAIGTSMISINERVNTLDNITIETAEHGIPPTYAFSTALDWDALPNTEVEPGAFYEVPVGALQRVSDGFYTPQPAQVSPDVVRHRETLAGETAQFLTGAFPAIFGGSMDNVDTASGYQMARNQALGRIGIVWRRMKFFHADVMMLAVDVFRKNRPDDVQMTIEGPAGKFISQWIHLADLKGNIFAYPESDEHYPTDWADQRSTLMQLMASPDPLIQQVLGHPENMELIKRLVGLEDLVVPDAQARRKQYREIAEMLQPGAQAVPSMEPGAPPMMMPSVMPDTDVDDNEAEADACQYWLTSDGGQEAKVTNPQGYLNVRAHFLIHKRVAAMAMVGAMPQNPPVRGKHGAPPPKQEGGPQPAPAANPAPQGVAA